MRRNKVAGNAERGGPGNINESLVHGDALGVSGHCGDGREDFGVTEWTNAFGGSGWRQQKNEGAEE